MKSPNITIAGAGYVGLSLAVLLSRNNHVKLIDVVESKINDICDWKSPIQDTEIESFFETAKANDGFLNLKPTISPEVAYNNADIVIIATPTDYDEQRDSFNTSSVEAVVDTVREFNKEAWIVIKSTVPVGYTKLLRERIQDERIVFSPEFLREGHALYDNLHPSRIIVGVDLDDHDSVEFGKNFADLLTEVCEEDADNVKKIICSSSEAEAVKLFANTYLAMRVSFFNELDTYASIKEFDSAQIIEGVCGDPRIGDFYNNPSFGYGGYCLPKDSKQLLANYSDVPQDIISAVVRSNSTRKHFIANEIINEADKQKSSVIGIYKLAMKQGSDNYRQSSVLDVIKLLKEQGLNVVIYDPSFSGEKFDDFEVIQDLDEFKKRATLIVANRVDSGLSDCSDRVYSKDIFGRD